MIESSMVSLCGRLTPAPDEKDTITKSVEEMRGESGEYLISANNAFADVNTLFDDRISIET